MSKIIPIKDLRDTNKISNLCKTLNEPIFVTKNGYEDMVLMSDLCYQNLIISQKSLQNPAKKIKSEYEMCKQSDIFGFVKIAAATIKISVGNISNNLEEIKKNILEALNKQVDVLVFQELTLCGYTANDLLSTNDLLNKCEAALVALKDFSKDKNILFVVGAPLRYRSKIYNCGVVIFNNQILGAIPKSYIPNYNEFYEKRYFESAPENNDLIEISDIQVPFGKKLIFQNLNYLKLRLGMEICEDLWAPDSPATNLAKNGANVILNLSASNETINKDEYRRTLLKATSAKLMCAYIYCSSGDGESTTDLIFSGHNLICENGTILKESKLFENEMTISDIDLELIENERIKNTSFKDKRSDCDYIYFKMELKNKPLDRKYSKYPFISSSKETRVKNSKQIILMQAKSLIQRLKAINCNKVVIAFSGGLDSTLALISTYEAFKLMNLPIENIHVLTLPSFGTSSLTYQNACKFAKELNTTFKEINIKDSLIQHFKDIDHDITNANVAFENAQARERTQIVLDYCNDINAIMIGTGDLSELCLGFTTFGGDHLSNYGLNASLPKTLIQAVVKDYADLHEEYKEVLYSILNTPISPELLPKAELNDDIIQKTEESIGVYELHDFFIYYFLNYNFSLKKIYLLATSTFKDKYSNEYIKNTFKTFIKRFFTNQFKRNCLPDGIKITPVSVSPRGDWRMASDVNYQEYIKEIDEFKI